MPDSNTPPTLETERLRLRAHQPADFADAVAMWSDPAITRFTIGSPAPPARTWIRILAYRGHWTLLGFGYWALEEKATGRYIGDIGFASFKRDIQPSIEGMPELGWALISEAQGKGYATEGLRAAVAWGDKHFGSLRTACIIHVENDRSFRVAEKLGFKESFRTTKDGEPEVVLIRQPPPGS